MSFQFFGRSRSKNIRFTRFSKSSFPKAAFSTQKDSIKAKSALLSRTKTRPNQGCSRNPKSLIKRSWPIASLYQKTRARSSLISLRISRG